MPETRTLDYGRDPRRGHLRRLVRLFFIFGLVFLGWRYYEQVASFASERFQAYRYAWVYDRTAKVIAGDGNLWIAKSDDASADQRLDALLAVSTNGVEHYWTKGKGRVLFVQAGKTNGQPWLAFACESCSGLEVFTFVRNDGSESGYDLLAETRQFWELLADKNARIAFDLVNVKQLGSVIETTVRINGEDNVFDWTITSALVSKWSGQRIALQSRLVDSSVTPLTGWVTGNKLLVNCDGFELRNGPAPTLHNFTGLNSSAMTYVPNGRVALAMSNSIDLIDVATGRSDNRLLSGAAAHIRVPMFSPNGLTCFAGYGDGMCVLIDTLTGMSHAVSGRVDGSTGTASFRNDQELVFSDPFFLRTFDCATGRSILLKRSNANTSDMVAAGGICAFNSFKTDQVVVQDMDGSKICAIDRPDRLQQISLSPEGRWMALQTLSSIQLVDVKAGEKIWEYDEIRQQGGELRRAKWSSDGLHGGIADGSFAYVWSLQSPRWVVRFPALKGGWWADVAFSADGKQLAATDGGLQEIDVWPDFDRLCQSFGKR
jgi:hypothetical protein